MCGQLGLCSVKYGFVGLYSGVDGFSKSDSRQKGSEQFLYLRPCSGHFAARIATTATEITQHLVLRSSTGKEKV